LTDQDKSKKEYWKNGMMEYRKRRIQNTAAVAAGYGWLRETESKDREGGKTKAGDRGAAAFVRDFGAQGALVASGTAPAGEILQAPICFFYPL
jgi:hypothetical protein